MLENVILTFVLIVLCIIITYWLFVLGFVYLGQKSKAEAKKIISEKLNSFYIFLENYAKKQEQIFYNVYIGSNGYGIRDDLIYKYFQKLEDLFEVWFFEIAYNRTVDTITYQFKVYDLMKDSIPRRRIITICRQLGEKALNQHFHEQGIYNLPIDKFVAVTWTADVLCFHFAINDEGFKTISDIRKLSH